MALPKDFMRKALRLASGRLVTGASTLRAALLPPVPTPPVSLYFDLNDGCNLDCTMCGSDKRSAAAQRVLDPESFRQRALPIFGHVADFQFGCLYEPMLVPYYEDAVTWIAGALPPGVRGKSISNGTLLTDRKIRRVIDSDIFRVLSFSVDAADEALFRRIRRGADYKTVIRNIASLIEYRTRQRSRTRIEFNFTIMRENIHELPALVQMAADLGIAGVTTHKLSPDDAVFVDDDYHREIEENLEKAGETAARCGIGFAGQSYLTGTTEGSPPSDFRGTCGFLESPVTVRLDCRGSLHSPCRKITGPLGNILDRGFDDILRGWKFRGMMHGFRSPGPATCCGCYMFVPAGCRPGGKEAGG